MDVLLSESVQIQIGRCGINDCAAAREEYEITYQPPIPLPYLFVAQRQRRSALRKISFLLKSCTKDVYGAPSFANAQHGGPDSRACLVLGPEEHEVPNSHSCPAHSSLDRIQILNPRPLNAGNSPLSNDKPSATSSPDPPKLFCSCRSFSTLLFCSHSLAKSILLRWDPVSLVFGWSVADFLPASAQIILWASACVVRLAGYAR